MTLTSGDELTLEGSSDVGGSNAGVLVLASGERTYIEWDEVERIDFE